MSDADGEADAREDRSSARSTGGWAEWFLLGGNRLLIAALGVLLFLVAVASLERSGLIPLDEVGGLTYLFGGFVSGNLTLVTVVVSINQLLLSRELQEPGELRSQMDDVVDYRRDVEEAAGHVAPVEPLEFLRMLFDNTQQEAQRLGGVTADTVETERREEIDDLVASVTEQMDRVDGLLERSGTGTFEVLSVTLTTNYARKINRIRRIRSRHGDELPQPVMDSLDRLVDRFQDVDVARQYFKGIYLQEELSSLSRVLLYTGALAEAVAAVLLLSFTGSGISSIARQTLSAVVPVAVAVCFLPLAVLASFVVRTAIVTQRTTTTLPFTTPEQEQ
ncbi:hypothetical protein [Halorarum salinum]|uniref:Uncharacterized protein n=1 Tax=Halorarum salinum TaxID=2743089 RepID=A0A7D5L8Z9_9EURY|nr:hypothetical protein [Halobaculum salinum]QLG60868.1 hypothetical protein HUG12_03550 [Halobaculum salinum]